MTAPVASDRPFRCISAQEAAEQLARHDSGALPDLLVFDVRDEDSYARSHIPGAQHLTMRSFPKVVSRLARSAPVMVYCYHGNASQTYAAMFADFRFSDVSSVDGGYAHLAQAVLAGDGQAALSAPSEAMRGFFAEHGLDLGNLERAGAQGLTPLMRAAFERRADLVDELLVAGAQPDTRNPDGNNALWLACVSEDLPSAQRLVEAGIDKDNRNDAGASCLMYAASAGKASMVEFLLAAGADPLLTNHDDARAVDLAATLACLKLLRHTVK